MQEKTAKESRLIVTRRYTSKEEKQSHIEKWEKSGLTMSEYCRQNNIPLANFSEWKRALMPKPTKFKPVQLIASQRPLPEAEEKSNNIIEVVVDQRIRIRLQQVADTSFLINIIKGLLTCN